MKEARRLLLLLSVLARYRRPMTVQEVRGKLPKGHRVHVRSIQRDLVSLRRWVKLEVDKTEKPYRWLLSPNAPCPCCWK